jgi:lysophospholipid acyltransferase (LPLAT)-like uncharacterized protein
MFFEDAARLPTAICRKQEADSNIATLKSWTAVGIPTEPYETITISLLHPQSCVHDKTQ